MGRYCLNSNGSFSYTPDPYYVGTDSFSYRATDGDKYSEIATVTITMPEDPDGDGLNNADEQTAGTNARNSDSDGDGLYDGTDPFPLDHMYVWTGVRAFGLSPDQPTGVAASKYDMEIPNGMAYEFDGYNWNPTGSWIPGGESRVAETPGALPVYLREEWGADSWDLHRGWNLISLPVDVLDSQSPTGVPLMNNFVAVAAANGFDDPKNFHLGATPDFFPITDPNGQGLALRAWISRSSALSQPEAIFSVANSARLSGASIVAGMDPDGQLWLEIAGQREYSNLYLPERIWNQKPVFTAFQIWDQGGGNYRIDVMADEVGPMFTTFLSGMPNQPGSPWGNDFSFPAVPDPSYVVRSDLFGDFPIGTEISLFQQEDQMIQAEPSARIYRDTPVWVWSPDWTTEDWMTLGLDGDYDGLPDHFEMEIVNADPNDSISDVYQVDGQGDFDGDGVADFREYYAGTSPVSMDTDGDGLSDAYEIAYGLYEEYQNDLFDPSAIRPFPRMHFTFDEAPGTYEVFSSAPGTAYSAFLSDTSPNNLQPGFLGNAVRTTATVYDVEEMNDWDSFSVSFWVSASDGPVPVFMRGGTMIMAGNGNLSMALSGQPLPTVNYAPDQEWHHIAISFGRSSAFPNGVCNVFVDGQHAALVPLQPYSMNEGGMPLSIGVDTTQTYLLDDVRIYDFALTAGQAFKLAEPVYDYDADGLSALGEAQAGTNPHVADSDGDGLSDGDETSHPWAPTNPASSDSDGDGMSDGWEWNFGFDPAYPDPAADDDWDGDGLTNRQESEIWADPFWSDDSDFDGLYDDWERYYFDYSLTEGTFDDYDQDGLSNAWEASYGTDPSQPDTDGDGVGDGWEADHALDPATSNNLQEAINAAWAGETIVVYPGEHLVANLGFMGKSITLSSLDPNDPAVVADTILRPDPASGGPVVAFYNGETPSTVLTGFTITGGTASGVSIAASPTISHCRIVENTSSYRGGGIEVFFGASPVIEHCTIQGNQAEYFGGGISIDGAYPLLRNLVIVGNSAGQKGGGLYVDNTLVSLEHLTIAANQSVDGGGIYLGDGADVQIRNSILWANAASFSDPLRADSIGSSEMAVAVVDYSIVDGGFIGYGDVTFGPDVSSLDPLFAELGDFHLASPHGRWTSSGNWTYEDLTMSPGLDAGDPASDYSNESEANGDRVNLGAYGNTSEASRSLLPPQILDSVSGSALTIPEETSAVVNIWLTTAPSAPLTLSVSLTGDTDLSISGGVSELYFDSGNWNVPQSITIDAGDDVDVDDGIGTLTISAVGIPDVNDRVITLNEDDDAVTLSIQTAGNGDVDAGGPVDPDHGPFILTATPDPGYGFVGWSTDNGVIDNAAAPSTTIDSITADATVTAEFTAVPMANGDAYNALGGVALVVAAPGVLANDSDPEGAALTASLQSGPSHGSLSLNSDGSFSYTAEATYDGIDQFTYLASDGYAQTAAVVTLTVTAYDPSEDFDGDGLANDDEAAAGTNLYATDSDNDGLSDGAEVLGLQTDPLNPDSDADGIPDGLDASPTTASAPATEMAFFTDASATVGLRFAPDQADPAALFAGIMAGSAYWFDPAANDWTETASLSATGAYQVTGSAPENARVVQAQRPIGIVLSLAAGNNLVTMPIDCPYPTSDARVSTISENLDGAVGAALQSGDQLRRGKVYWITASTAAVIDLVNDWHDNADADLLPDAWEIALLGAHYASIAEVTEADDPDQDGLENLAELMQGTDPLSADTDGDGILDGYEVQHGLVPDAPASPEILWWPLDNSLASMVGSPNLDAASIGVDAPAYDVGLLGTALTLSANLSAATTDASTLDAFSALGVSFWLKAPPGVPDGLLLSREGSFRIDLTAGAAMVEIAGYPAQPLTSAILDDGSWHHLLIAIDPVASNPRATLYLDGVRIQSEVFATSPGVTLNVSGKQLILGESPYYGIAAATASVDDLRIFDAALNLGDALRLSEPNADPDGDTLNNLTEGLFGSFAQSADSDQEGLDDALELALGTHPRLTDTDFDGVDDRVEWLSLTNPLDPNQFGGLMIGDLAADWRLESDDRTALEALLGYEVNRAADAAANLNLPAQADLDQNQTLNERDLEIFDRLNALEDDPQSIKLLPILTTSDEWEWQQ